MSEHSLSNADRKVIADIENTGWSVFKIDGTDYLPSFAYTVGLWKNYKHPEIILFGINIDYAHSILNDIGTEIKKGKTFSYTDFYNDILEDYPVAFLDVDPRNIPDYFGYAIWYYKNQSFPAYQLVWPDRNKFFPWENQFDANSKYAQPLLDRNADFKFREEKDLSVFTSIQHLRDKKPILSVFHNEDGAWQFLTGEENTETTEDGRLVSLEQMIASDKTLNDVFNLDYAEEAHRDHVGGKWMRHVSEFSQDDETSSA